VIDWKVASVFDAFFNVSVPKLVASAEGLEGSLVDYSALFEWRFGSGC
jgi:hypothetical protein